MLFGSFPVGFIIMSGILVFWIHDWLTTANRDENPKGKQKNPNIMNHRETNRHLWETRLDSFSHDDWFHNLGSLISYWHFLLEIVSTIRFQENANRNLQDYKINEFLNFLNLTKKGF